MGTVFARSSCICRITRRCAPVGAKPNCCMKRSPCALVMHSGCAVPVSYTHLDVYKRQAVASSNEEMEALIRNVIDPLPGVANSSCNIILSRIKDVKGLRL